MSAVRRRSGAGSVRTSPEPAAKFSVTIWGHEDKSFGFAVPSVGFGLSGSGLEVVELSKVAFCNPWRLIREVRLLPLLLPHLVLLWVSIYTTSSRHSNIVVVASYEPFLHENNFCKAAERTCEALKP